MTTEVDIVIVGGGMIGATTALAIAKSCPSLRIAIIEPTERTAAQQPSYDDRSIAIANASASFLADYGVWEALAPYAANIHDIQVSDRGHFGKTYITAEQHGVNALGHVLEVTHLGRELHRVLDSLPQVTWYCPDKVESFTSHQESIECVLASGANIRCALVLACDGGRSKTREQFHISTTAEPYEQTALIANVSVQNGFEHRAFERFTEHGPMALLPLPDNRYSLVWCHTDEEVKKLLSLPEADFIRELQSAFGFRAGKFTRVSQRDSYPLYLVQAQRFTQHRMALIGNAAHSIHPIAGQGYNLGIRDVEVVRQVIVQATANSQDIGSAEVLADYSALRTPDINKVVSLTDGLVRLFSQPSKLVALGRSIGLTATQFIPSAKTLIATQAMGWNGIRKSANQGVK